MINIGLHLAALTLALGSGSVKQTSVQPIAPVALFNAVCMEGSGRLPQSAAKLIAFNEVADGAKLALGRSLKSGPYSGLRSAPGVQNVTYLVDAGKRVYLLLPQTVDGKLATSDFASSCAVVWRGDNYAAAVRSILPTALPQQVGRSFSEAPSSLPNSNPEGSAFTRTYIDKHELTAAAWRGWIVLRSQPTQSSNSGVR